MIEEHLKSIGNALNELCLRYENFILIGNFNSEITGERMKSFCNTYHFKCLVKEPTCFKDIDNPSCIDLILTNKHFYFRNNCVIETGLSDFHKLTIITLKSNFQKHEPKIITYRNYKKVNNDNFRNELEYRICQEAIYNIECNALENLFMETLNKHAP